MDAPFEKKEKKDALSLDMKNLISTTTPAIPKRILNLCKKKSKEPVIYYTRSHVRCLIDPHRCSIQFGFSPMQRVSTKHGNATVVGVSENGWLAGWLDGDKGISFWDGWTTEKELRSLGQFKEIENNNYPLSLLEHLSRFDIAGLVLFQDVVSDFTDSERIKEIDLFFKCLKCGRKRINHGEVCSLFMPSNMDDSKEHITFTDSSKNRTYCPICYNLIPSHEIDKHVDTCQPTPNNLQLISFREAFNFPLHPKVEKSTPPPKRDSLKQKCLTVLENYILELPLRKDILDHLIDWFVQLSTFDFEGPRDICMHKIVAIAQQYNSQIWELPQWNKLSKSAKENLYCVHFRYIFSCPLQEACTAWDHAVSSSLDQTIIDALEKVLLSDPMICSVWFQSKKQKLEALTEKTLKKISKISLLDLEENIGYRLLDSKDQSTLNSEATVNFLTQKKEKTEEDDWDDFMDRSDSEDEEDEEDEENEEEENEDEENEEE